MIMDNDAIRLASSLIRIPSVTGSEGEIISFLDSYLADAGFSTEILPSGSLIGIIDGGMTGPTTVLDGHIDTVGIDDESEWSFPPFAGDVADGMIRGRGASDMKCGVAASIVAASRFAGQRFPGRIVVACIVEEERFEGIASREVSERLYPDYVIIAESTDGRLNIGQRGRAEIQIESYGRSCHSSNPEEGSNAIYAMIEAIGRIDSMPLHSHPLLRDKEGSGRISPQMAGFRIGFVSICGILIGRKNQSFRCFSHREVALHNFQRIQERRAG